jgi:hypothetical protein
MDPNACWNSIVQDICELNARTDIDASLRKLATRDLAESLRDLANWIGNGGFLPALTLRNGGFVAERFNNGWSMVGTTTEKDPEPVVKPELREAPVSIWIWPEPETAPEPEPAQLTWSMLNGNVYSSNNRFRIQRDMDSFGLRIWRLYDSGAYVQTYIDLNDAKRIASER